MNRPAGGRPLGNLPAVSSPPPRARPGKRALRPRFRRARTLGGALGLTLMGAALPGSAYLWSGRRNLGWIVLLPSLTALGLAVWYAWQDPRAVLNVAFDPTRLQVAAIGLGAGLLIWFLVVVTTYVMVRPRPGRWTHTLLGSAFVGVLCVAVASPVMLGARYAMVQADLVQTVFEDNESATVPKHVTVKDPWGGRDRVNVLLLGGDGGVHRIGVRTDTMILLSMDTRTGRTTMFSLPRNMMNAQFPADSPLHALYPEGFNGYGDPGSWMLNAVYRMVPELHPGVLGRSDNEGADALKQAVSGSLGVPVDYYLLVNLQGFRQIVDAMGGVTVNINEPIPVGGNTDLGILPERYLEPGPDQRLDGFDALWFSRGRYGSDDYQRMERQRCMIDAIIEEARPLNLLRRYQALAAAGKRIIRSDIPSKLLPAFVDLAVEIKGASVRSVVFRSSDEFFPGDPDYTWMRQVVRKALVAPAERGRQAGDQTRPEPSSSPSGSPSPAVGPSEEPDPGTAVEAADTCGYHPATS
jgi:polyisoprenyl-teichoic acid--peptidoglycan teichoic acid transferase